MVKRLATLPHDPLGITDSAYKNQSVMVSVQYGPFNTYIPIRSTTIDLNTDLTKIKDNKNSNHKINVAEMQAFDKHFALAIGSDPTSDLLRRRPTCTMKANVNELSLVNSAVNGVIVKQQIPTGSSAAGVNQMSTEYRLNEQLMLGKYHMNSEKLNTTKATAGYEQMQQLVTNKCNS
ncbi:hypothetical protein F511_36294 [Dorcoceras hygrometricum]|uniref:Uncharacterized protein n=1 Tax=Dorcoceras hygrometricum TaxID=472368 RepID=A0A2Z7A554_9LAMI|nr:hypothetical protein F511_36294 [Dorcoceras hygrometricum]